MKRFFCIICVLIAALSLTMFASCSTERSDGALTFLSVRMKGNGDGTITAVVQNEFSLLPAVLPVTLTVYRSDEMTTDRSQMDMADSVQCDDLNIFGKLKTVIDVGEGGYYLAEARFEVNGESLFILSDTIGYDALANRIN